MRYRTKLKLWLWFRYYLRPKLSEKKYLRRCGVCHKIHISSCRRWTCYCKSCRMNGGSMKLREINYEKYQRGQGKILDSWAKPFRFLVTLKPW